MAFFTKKPVTIEAFQLTPEARTDRSTWPVWAQEAWGGDARAQQAIQAAPSADSFDNPDTTPLLIIWPEDMHTARIGDWIVLGIAGEIYAVDGERFALLYDETAPPAEEGGEAPEGPLPEPEVDHWNGE